MSLKKTATQDKPHAIFANYRAGWTWRVLKTYKKAASEARDEYARWLCAVSSPYTHGGADMGDTYAREVMHSGALAAATQEWLDEYPMIPLGPTFRLLEAN